MTRWQYQMVKVEAYGFRGGQFDAPEVVRHMNKLGSEGWELVTAFDTNASHGRSRDIVLLFKRPDEG